MIRFRDANTLALTKLRTRKVRLAVTVIISGLLFTGLAGASMVARGAFSSIESFSDEGFGKRYIVLGISEQVFGFFEDPAVIARAKQIHQQTLDRKVTEAKRLKLTYDPKSEPLPVQEYESPDGTRQMLDFNHPAAKQAIDEYIAERPAVGLPEMKYLAGDYGAEKFYESKQLPQLMDGTSLNVLKDGKETYGHDKQQFGPPTGIDSFTGFWQAASNDLLEPFILPDQSLDGAEEDAIPIIVPFSAAEELLGMQALPASSSTSDKLERTKQVRASADSIRFDVCIRNNTSSNLINQALSAQQEIELNKDDEDYRQPSLIYGLPEEACGASPVIRDVRTVSEKQAAARQEEFDRIFGKQPPEQQKISFRVVGVVPDIDFGAASTVGQIIRSLVVSSLGSGWYTPLEYVESNPVLSSLFEGGNSMFGMPPSYYAEFTSPDEARTFLDQASCNPDFSGNSGKGSAPYEECREEGKPFMLSAYGSNSLALDSAKRGFGKVFRIAALVIALIAAIIMMGTVGRMIADSRRETAVFRAIGAKKLDIAQIYLLYTVMLSILICLFALLVGTILASVVQARFSDEVTVEALVAYNSNDLNRTFSLYNLYWPDILQLVGLALAGGIISAILPLFRNLRRNPIKDMRDDT